MRLLRIPGVFAPLSDTWLLGDRLRNELRRGATVADVCTGSGALAILAARAGAGRVTAVDVSRRAVIAARINARLNGVSIRAVRGDLFGPLANEEVDLIVSNPPYVPAETGAIPTRGPERGWDAGRDGRTLLDRICAGAWLHLRPGGTLLLVHSDVCGTDRTLAALEATGMMAEVVESRRGPLGPLLSARTAHLEREGLLEPGARDERLVVIRARRERASAARRSRTAASRAS